MNTPLLELLRTDFVAFLFVVVAIIEAIALHEFAHAYVADLQGDRLPRAMGRLSLNPARHLDPLGTICIVLIGFGWGKPVEFRPTALRSRRFGAALVALAGPSMNLLLAFLGALGTSLAGARLVGDAILIPPGGITEHVVNFCLTFLGINVILAVFNLIPLPPLDGSRLLTIFLPPSRQNVIYFLDRYGFLILLALVFLGGTTVLFPLVQRIQVWMLTVAQVL